MAKLMDTEITAAHLDRYLSTEDDFAFELSTYEMLKSFKTLVTQHGGTYTDPLVGKKRQFDIRAGYTVNDWEIYMAVECKNLRPNFPLVVSRVAPEGFECYHEIFVRPDGLVTEIPRGTLIQASRISGIHSIYDHSIPVGRATSQIGFAKPDVFHADDSDVHEGWDQAIASSYDLIKTAAERIRSGAVNIKRVAIIPFLVVPDNRLWACDYGSGGRRSPVKRMDEITYAVDYRPQKAEQFFEFKLSRIHFVTTTGMKKFIDRLMKDHEFLGRLFGR